MKLEIIARRPNGQPNPKKLLFVHGICVGAWIWDEHFLPYFAEAGYEAYALSLRGHGKSAGKKGLKHWSLSDYTQDLEQAAQEIGGDLIVVGHSLGGAVVQNWIRSGAKVKGAALLASVPPWGLSYSAWHMGINHPVLFQEIIKMVTLGLRVVDTDTMNKGLFSDDISKESLQYFFDLVQDESQVVSAELQAMCALAPMPWKSPPMFVAAGMNDKFIPKDEVWRTAAYYGTSPVMIDNLAHAVMADTRWEKMAAALLKWLGSFDS